jgi:hypothetical protein
MRDIADNLRIAFMGRNYGPAKIDTSANCHFKQNIATGVPEAHRDQLPPHILLAGH